MSKILGIYKNDFEEIIHEEKFDSNMSEIYCAHNKKDNRECFLKVMSKEQFQTEDYIFLQERLKNEQNFFCKHYAIQNIL